MSLMTAIYEVAYKVSIHNADRVYEDYSWVRAVLENGDRRFDLASSFALKQRMKHQRRGISCIDYVCIS